MQRCEKRKYVAGKTSILRRQRLYVTCVYALTVWLLTAADDVGATSLRAATTETAGDLYGHLGRHHPHHTTTSSTAHTSADDSFTKSNGDTLMGCKELRSKKYISDGACTSIRPIIEVVCAGVCLPIAKLPWYTDLVNVWSRPEDNQWQCVDDVIKRKRISLLCQDGLQRSYTVRTVKSCKCKKRKRVNHRPADIGSR